MLLPADSTQLASLARKSAVAGFVFWLASALIRIGDTQETELIERVFLFATLVVVPLGLLLVATPTRQGRHALPYRLAIVLQPVCAISVFISLYMQKGWLAGLVATPWLAIDILLALFGIWRLAQRGLQPIEEFSIDAALLYPTVGGVSLVLYQLDVQPLGFGATIILLTAVHFHFAGFAAPIIAGMTGRLLRASGQGRAMLYVALTLIFSSMPIVAAGITYSPLVALVGALTISIGLLLLATLTIGSVLLLLDSIAVRVLLIVSAVSSVAAMVLATAYAYSIVTKTVIIDIPAMALTHGLFNAFGFAFCGLVAWSIIQPLTRATPPGIPFSKLPSKRFAGPHYFERVAAVDEVKSQPCGLVDSFSIYDREDFKVDRIEPSIRSFYEETYRYVLTVTPNWKSGFRLGGSFVHWLGVQVGQLSLPIATETPESRVDTRLVPIKDASDGRVDVRGWIRTYTGGNTAMYVAAYSTHTSRAVTYMNIAFPLPGGNLTSVLNIADSPDHRVGTGIVLSTLSSQNALGDQGIYFANLLLPLRLPLNESIAVWVNSNGELKARHDMWLWRINFLTLEYDIRLAENDHAPLAN